ncbi:MAG: DUF1007 family protein [Pseudomonadota bacterium]
MTVRDCLYTLVACSAVAGPAAAHPHVFVDAKAGFVMSEGELTGLRITWTYDAFTTLTLFDILDLDKDGDGLLDDADRAAIVAGETEWAEDYKGDTYLAMSGVDVPLGRPRDGAAFMAEDRITVSFELPLAAPQSVDDTVVLRLYDPNYYYAYSVVGLEDMALDDCEASVIPFVAGNATAELQTKLALLSREETPEQADVGRLFADQIVLTCA